jgi:hypothetical protein
MRKRLTYAQQALLVQQAITPDLSQYITLYVSPFRPGLCVASLYSPDRLDTVRQQFNYEYHDERPRVLLAHCPGPN